MNKDELSSMNDEQLEKALAEAYKRYFSTEPESNARGVAIADIEKLENLKTKRREVDSGAETEASRAETEKKQGRARLVIEGLKVAATVGLTILGIKASNNQLAQSAKFEETNVWSTQTARNRLQLPKIDFTWLKH